MHVISAPADGQYAVYVPGPLKTRAGETAKVPREVIDIEAPRFDLAVTKALNSSPHISLQRPA